MRVEARAAPLRGTKNHLGREQRTKFVSVSSVLRRAANEFVRPVKVPDEAGGAELGDGGGWEIEGVEWDSVGSIIFHAASMTEGVGHQRSNQK